MSFWDNVKKFAQPYGDDDYDEYEDEEVAEGFEEEVAEETTTSRRSRRSVSSDDYGLGATTEQRTASTGFSGQILNVSSGKQEVVLFHAKTFDDAAKAADELRVRKAVILNMENVDKALTRRVVDFLSGSVYALQGSVKKVAQCTYLFCPHNMDVIGDLESMQIEADSMF